MHLYIDPVGGIAGDMFCALLLDLGLSMDDLQQELQKLNIPKQEFDIKNIQSNSVMRGVFRCTHFDVPLLQSHTNREHDHHHHHHEHHHHEHHHHEHHHHEHHHHEHHHETSNLGPQVTKGTGVQRNYKQIRDMISSSSLSTQVQDNALRIFENLAIAEAKIHGMKVDDVQFHEVGAIDSIIDIVGVCIGLEKLQISKLFLLRPPPISTGEIWTAHGKTPLPAPATSEILKGRSVRNGFEGHEQCTPTGAAIVVGLNIEIAAFPQESILYQSGYGAGTRNPIEYPNILRGFVFAEPSSFMQKKNQNMEVTPTNVMEISFQVDDMTGEELGFAMNVLLEQGALDVFFQQISMKKNRPATLVTVLCSTETREKIENCIFTHTSTFGFRYRGIERKILQRRWEDLWTEIGNIRVKIGYNDESILQYSIEYDDLQKFALHKKISLQQAKEEIVSMWKKCSKTFQTEIT